jgi:hypothetical protein
MLRCQAALQDNNDGTYTVEVWSPDLAGITATYTVEAKADNYAAQEAIERFISDHGPSMG